MEKVLMVNNTYTIYIIKFSLYTYMLNIYVKFHLVSFLSLLLLNIPHYNDRRSVKKDKMNQNAKLLWMILQAKLFI